MLKRDEKQHFVKNAWYQNSILIFDSEESLPFMFDPWFAFSPRNKFK